MYFMKRIIGSYGAENMAYLTRFKLTPMTRWGQLYIHFFHRGDYDRSFHDHPYDFWTFPLRTYYERVLDLSTGRDTLNAVKAWRWHHRPAEYTHLQMGAMTHHWENHMDAETGYETRPRRVGTDYNGPTVTLLWRKPTRRKWGFWVRNHEVALDYSWIYHKDYENVT